MSGLHRFASIALLLTFVCPAVAQQPDVPPGDNTLVGQLRSLSEEHGFRVQGIDKVADAPARRAAGELNARIRLLLDDYNHVVEGTATEVSRVIIIGPKTPAASGFSLKTSRKGLHHSVNTTLNGDSGHSVRTELMVDTGASTLVLPASLMPALGFRGEDLPDREVQTVNGRMTGKLVSLERVSTGGATASDVEALFVDDERLGGAGLLGMSFLEHFSMTIHDTDNRLVLTPR